MENKIDNYYQECISNIERTLDGMKLVLLEKQQNNDNIEPLIAEVENQLIKISKGVSVGIHHTNRPPLPCFKILDVWQQGKDTLEVRLVPECVEFKYDEYQIWCDDFSGIEYKVVRSKDSTLIHSDLVLIKRIDDQPITKDKVDIHKSFFKYYGRTSICSDGYLNYYEQSEKIK